MNHAIGKPSLNEPFRRDGYWQAVDNSLDVPRREQNFVAAADTKKEKRQTRTWTY